MTLETVRLRRLTPYEICRRLDSAERRDFLRELLQTARDANIRRDFASPQAKADLKLLCQLRHFRRFEYLWIGTTKAEIVQLLKRFGITELAKTYLGYQARAHN